MPSDDTAHILCWRDKAKHEVHYIPTDPPAHKWRGPFSSDEIMRRKAMAELHTPDVVETWTTILPHHMRADAHAHGDAS